MRADVRSVALTFLLILTLAGCGGGGSNDQPPPVDQPVILEYAADRPVYAVGERAKLTVRYAGGAGRIDPGIGEVGNAVTVETPPLDITTRYELVVQSSKGVVRKQLTLQVAYRGRYRALATPLSVALHSAVLADDGSVLIIGGSRGESTLSDAIDRFDPRTETITRIGSLTAGGIMGGTTTRLEDGRILIAGGVRVLTGPRHSELINERTGHAVATGATRRVRLNPAAAALADGRVLITGGYTDEGFPDASQTAEIWDPGSGEFRMLANYMNLPRAFHTATTLADGRVLIVGGLVHGIPYLLAEIFDPETEEFTPVPANEQLVRGFHESIELEDGSVLVIGGEDEIMNFHRSVLLWDRASGVFERLPDLLASRSLIRATATRSDQVLIFGGATREHPRASGSAELYTRAGGIPLPPLPEGRAWHTVTRLSDGRVLIVGGEDADGNLTPQVLLYE